MMPRDCRALADVCCGGGVGLAAGKRRVPAGTFLLRWEDTTAPGSRRRPSRSGLMRAERDNPVVVQPRVDGAGRPTVREAEFRSGHRMAQEANAGVSKGDGKTARIDRSSKRSCRITGRIRVLVARLERGLTWAGWVCEENG